MTNGRWLTALTLVAVASVANLGDLDWGLLAGAGSALFHGAGLRLYAVQPELTAGPAAVLAYAPLSAFGQDVSAVLTHIAMWALSGWALFAAGRTDRVQASATSPVRLPRIVLVVIGALPALVWNLPPFNGSEALLWSAAVVTLLALAALPRSGAWLRGQILLSRLELSGLLLIGSWAALASGTAHLEDAVAITLLVWSAQSSRRGHTLQAALAVGLAITFKPWAVAGVGVLLRRDSPGRVIRDASVAGVVIAAGWLPFLIAGHGDLHAAHDRLPIAGSSTLSLLGFGGTIPAWMRTLQLTAIVVAALAARRAGPTESIAAGMCVRLLLDPATFSYYLSTAAFAVGTAELAAGRPPKRLLVLLAAGWLAPCFITDLRVLAVVRTAGLVWVLCSYCVFSRPSPRPVRAESEATNPTMADALA